MKMHVKTKVKTQIFTTTLTLAHIAGEFAKAHGLDDLEIGLTQQAISCEYAKIIIIYGCNKQGHSVEENRLEIDWSKTKPTISLPHQKNMSVSEALDPSLAEAIAFLAKGMRNKGLTAELAIVFQDHIYADPKLYALVSEQLCTTRNTTPQTPPGTTRTKRLSLSPGKGSGLTFSSFTALFK